MDPIKAAYSNAKSRCINPNNKSYEHYGGRGIKFLFNTFEEFLKELGPRPPNHTLDRIDNNKHYEIGNVKWSTRQEQVLNRRKFHNNTSGITNIYFKKTHNAWVARIRVNGKRITIYHGKSFTEAQKALANFGELS